MGTKNSSEVDSAQGEAVFTKTAHTQSSSKLPVIFCAVFAVLFCVSLVFNVLQLCHPWNKDSSAPADNNTASAEANSSSSSLAEQLRPSVGSKYIVLPAFSAQIEIPGAFSRLESAFSYGLTEVTADDTDTQHAVFCLTALRYAPPDDDYLDFSSKDPDSADSASSCLGYMLDIYDRATYQQYIDEVDYADTEKVYENSAYVFLLEDNTGEDLFPEDSGFQDDLFDELLKMYQNNIKDYKEE